jgi:hypothetical protein
MTNWTHEIAPDGVHHIFRRDGWRIDVWADWPVAGMYHETRTGVLEFGTLDELAARAAELEAQS